MVILAEREAIIFLGKALKEANKFHNKHWKNIFKHSLWVYFLLKDHWFISEVCIAGVLHDILEDTLVTESLLKREFGDTIAKLVVANTLDKSLGKIEAKDVVLSRCYCIWEWAIAIKIADIYDSYIFYKKIWNREEAQRSVVFKEMIEKRQGRKGWDEFQTELLEKIL